MNLTCSVCGLPDQNVNSICADQIINVQTFFLDGHASQFPDSNTCLRENILILFNETIVAILLVIKTILTSVTTYGHRQCF